MEEKKLTLADTVTTLIENKKYSSVRDILLTMQAVDIAAMFEEVPEQKIPLLFRILPKDLASDTFVEMSAEQREYLALGMVAHGTGVDEDEIGALRHIGQVVTHRAAEPAHPFAVRLILLTAEGHDKGGPFFLFVLGAHRPDGGRHRRFFCSSDHISL